MVELHLEYTCIYTRYYNLLLKLKEQNTANPQIMAQLERDVKADLAEKNKQVLACFETDRDKFKEGVNPQALENWIVHFRDDPEVQRLGNNIKKLHEEVFKHGKIEAIDFDLPAKLDKNQYIKIYRKIWATLRHDLWCRIQQEKKERNTSHLSEE